MTRIISGSARGQRLTVPAKGTRPTSDRIREALFSSFESWLAAQEKTWSDIHLVDMYAGSGAIGLEAASRGAEQVTLIELNHGAVGVIQQNSQRLKLPITVNRADASLWRPSQSVDIVFLDPPYDTSEASVRELVHRLCQHENLNGALVVVERSARAGDPFQEGDNRIIQKKWDRSYGDSRLWYGHLVEGAL